MITPFNIILAQRHRFFKFNETNNQCYKTIFFKNQTELKEKLSNRLKTLLKSN